MDVVEIDPVVIRVARDYFGTGHYPQLRSVAMDARRFVVSTETRYDVVIGDVYLGTTIPAHLITRELFDAVARRLSDRGLYMMNVISAVKGPASSLFAAVMRTLTESFGADAVHAFATVPERPDQVQNLVLLASTARFDLSRLLREAERGRPSVARLLRTRLDWSQLEISGAPVLTDQRSSAELLAARRRATN